MRGVKVLALVLLLVLVPQLAAAQEIGPLPPPSLSGEWVAGLVYVLLMVAIEFVPRFAEIWDPFAYKREAVAGAGLLAVIALVGLNYAGAFDLEIGSFGWSVVGQAFNAWLAFLGGSWLVWSLLDRGGALPRKRDA
jgi:hypothetical protein